MAYHTISRLLPGAAGFRKSARLTQVVMRLSGVRDASDTGMVPRRFDRGENLLVEFALSKLLDCINNEQWDLADDVIAGFPPTCHARSAAVFERLAELRREFERMPGRQVVLADLGLGGEEGGGAAGDGAAPDGGAPD